MFFGCVTVSTNVDSLTPELGSLEVTDISSKPREVREDTIDTNQRADSPAVSDKSSGKLHNTIHINN